MHLLHRSSVFGGNGDGKTNTKAVLRRVGSSPRAPPRLTMSRSESVKKRTGGSGSGTKKGGKHGSKRARLRAGLATALQDLRLAGRRKLRELSVSDQSGATKQPVAQVGALCSADAAAAARTEKPAVSTTRSRGVRVEVLPLLLLVLALTCVVALGRAPAVCCCTYAAWLCRGSSVATTTNGRRQGEVRLRSGTANAVVVSVAAVGQRR